jgi:uncharacterized protein YxjI
VPGQRRDGSDELPSASSPPAAGGTHLYQMREKLATIGDDFWIENSAGQRVFKVDGRALRIRETLKIKDVQGREVAEILDRPAAVRGMMNIVRDGQAIATVTKALLTPLRGRFSVNVAAGGAMDVEGNILAHRYTIEQDSREIAEISKQWFHARDSYGVDIQPGQDDALILAITVVVDQLLSDVG